MNIFSLLNPSNPLDEFDYLQAIYTKYRCPNLDKGFGNIIQSSLKIKARNLAANDKYHYTIEFPITNDIWTNPIFSFFIEISPDYYIVTTSTIRLYLIEAVFKLASSKERYPFVFYKKG